jgi:type IV secretory pathway VirB10-like protein
MVLLSENESEISPTSGTEMQNIGFVEKTDTEKPEMIKFLVDSAKGINTSKIIKEVSPMTDTTENVEAEAPVADAPAVEESQVAPEADAAIVSDLEKSEYPMDEEKKKSMKEKMEDEEEDMKAEKSEDMEDDESEDDKGYKKSDVVEGVSKSEDAVVAAVAEIKDGITSAFSDLTSVVKSLGDEVAELKKSLDLANAKLADAENDFNEFGKRVDAVEADTAFRKSGDLGEIVQNQPETVEKSLWGGRFLKTADLFR